MFTNKLRPSQYLIRLEQQQEVEVSGLCVGLYKILLYQNAQLEIGDF